MARGIVCILVKDGDTTLKAHPLGVAMEIGWSVGLCIAGKIAHLEGL